jgi:hypothetical protein
MAHGGRRNADEALAALLAAGKTARDAAAEVGIAERTVARRLVDPKFRARIATLRAEMVQTALGKMSDGMTEAVDTLRMLLKAESDTVKLGAARSMIELVTKLRESTELNERLVRVEEFMKEKEKVNHAI